MMDKLKQFPWPESLRLEDGSTVHVEYLYQIFKERLMRELAGESKLVIVDLNQPKA